MPTANKLKHIILENAVGKAVRVFACEGENAQLIFRKDNKRLTLANDLTSFEEQKIPFKKMAQVDFASLKQQALPIAGFGQLRAVEQVGQTIFDKREKAEQPTNLLTALCLALTIIFSFVASLFNTTGERINIEDELKQHVVKIVKHTPPKTAPPPPQQQVSAKNRAKPKVKRRSVKRLGALAALGRAKKNSKHRGGLNLGAIKTSPGPGPGGGTQGSGGMQTSLYGKGLIAAPVGPGANIRGRGGYGTKGKGGGQDGYGQTSLIGSSGTATIPIGTEYIVKGGLDPDAIARIIQKNMGQIRFCYEQGLQRDPKLTGRVAVKFVIGGRGSVKSAALKSSTLGSQVVEGCILGRLKTWKFPTPKGGVDVKVAYPFLLRRTQG